MDITIINPLFRGSLSARQNDGLQAILNGCAQFLVTDQRMVAYILATAYWETGRSMQPVAENGLGVGHPYGNKIKENGTVYTTPDEIYYGRGLVQVNWYENYEMLTNQGYAKLQGWDFLNNPGLLLEMKPSVWAMIHCMWNGLFTGIGLQKYFNDTATDPVNARKIVNGLDQAQTIADFYQTFYQGLTT